MRKLKIYIIGVYRCFERYGALGSVRLLADLIYTRCLFRNCRLIRRPVFIRGRNFIHLGESLTTGVSLRLDALVFFGPADQALLHFGSNVQLNDYVHIAAAKRVIIGNNVLIASKVFISDHDHGNYSGDGDHDTPEQPPVSRRLQCSEVVIEDNVWLGEMVSVLPGSHIGYGAVIGAGSVVKGRIPPRSIAVGVPAKVIKQFNPATGRWERISNGQR
jgi:acetyltransferase-like isoleucine patch superfamily enzyme